MSALPVVSIIIPTDGRAASLGATLTGLRYLRYPRFEVVVVAGPTADGTRELLQGWAGEIKLGYCAERNINKARNIGLEISAGEIVAFIDDDAIAEPEWLDVLVPAFTDESVGVAGGFVIDHYGKQIQWGYVTANRFGTADISWVRATPEFNFPLSFNFPYAAGTNSAFRRSAAVEVGGFDEEIEYFLEETDMACRLVDRGWRVAQVNRAFVHHKFLANAIRNERSVQTSWYSIIKNKIYFALVNGRDFAPLNQIVGEAAQFIGQWRAYVREQVDAGALIPGDNERFEREADRALLDGLDRGLRGARQLVCGERLRGKPDSFLPFPVRLPAAQQRCFVFVSANNYPPAALGGIGHYVQQLACAMAARGHQVHVLTRHPERDRVDFEDGVWVHRCLVRDFPPATADGMPIPRHVWNWSMTMLAEAKEIAARRPVDCVHAPICDGEAIAFLRDRSFRLVTGLHSTFSCFPEGWEDPAFMRDWVRPMLAVERELLTGSDGILANSNAAVAAFERAHAMPLDRDRVCLVPHGIEDTGGLPAELPARLPDGSVRLLFVGRLEARKGMDVLLQIVPDLLLRQPQVHFDFVGNDKIPCPDGRPWRTALAEKLTTASTQARLAFHGEVSDARLRGFYRAADIVVAPSLFESFGLVHVEAMMLGKPVVACRSAATPELILDRQSGLLAEPGDAASLRDAIERLLGDPELRRRLGEAARARYLACFTAERMAADEEAFLLRVAQVPDAQGRGCPEQVRA